MQSSYLVCYFIWSFNIGFVFLINQVQRNKIIDEMILFERLARWKIMKLISFYYAVLK